jgi:hypothetical protein
MRSMILSRSICLEARGDGAEHRGQRGALAFAARADCSSLPAIVCEQRVEVLGERGDALLEERVGDLGHVDLVRLERLEVGLGVVDASSIAFGRTAPWSRTASIVFIGIVFTVSRPTSVSTYIVSG